MLKIVLFFAVFLSLNSFAGVIETCRDGKFPAGDETNWYWVDSDINIVVNRGGNYYAQIKFNGKVEDVDSGIQVSFTNTIRDHYSAILKILRVNPAQIDHAIHYDFHPEANEDDMAGFSLLVVKSKTGTTLAKIFQAGWGLGVCK